MQRFRLRDPEFSARPTRSKFAWLQADAAKMGFPFIDFQITCNYPNCSFLPGRNFGVILYQLLVGVHPFEVKALRAAGLEAILRLIREKEPPKPSTRIRSMGPASIESAEKRKEEPRSFARRLQGELDRSR